MHLMLRCYIFLLLFHIEWTNSRIFQYPNTYFFGEYSRFCPFFFNNFYSESAENFFNFSRFFVKKVFLFYWNWKVCFLSISVYLIPYSSKLIFYTPAWWADFPDSLKNTKKIKNSCLFKHFLNLRKEKLVTFKLKSERGMSNDIFNIYKHCHSDNVVKYW